MSNIGQGLQPTVTCSKRVWVMTVLSDDEALADHGRLPHGLRFHLSRCPSCRALADGLRSVTDGLGLLADLEPSEALTSDADQQAHNALEAGARLTGRVDVVEPVSPVVSGAWRTGWPNAARYAAAAVIGLSLGAAGLWSQRQPPAQTVASGAGVGSPVRTAKPLEPGLERPDDVRLPDPTAEAHDAKNLARAEPARVVAEPPAGPGLTGPEAVAGVTPVDGSDERGASTESAFLLGPPARPISNSGGLPLCRHLTYLEAAECEHGHTLDKPLILPRIEGRRMPRGRRAPRQVDIPTKTRSTVPRPPQRKGDRPSG